MSEIDTLWSKQFDMDSRCPSEDSLSNETERQLSCEEKMDLDMTEKDQVLLKTTGGQHNLFSRHAEQHANPSDIKNESKYSNLSEQEILKNEPRSEIQLNWPSNLNFSQNAAQIKPIVTENSNNLVIPSTPNTQSEVIDPNNVIYKSQNENTHFLQFVSRVEALSNLLHSLPETPSELFQTPLDLSLLAAQTPILSRLQKFIERQIQIFIGEADREVAAFLVQKVMAGGSPESLIELLQEALDSDAEMFVAALWRMLQFEQRKLRFLSEIP